MVAEKEKTLEKVVTLVEAATRKSLIHLGDQEATMIEEKEEVSTTIQNQKEKVQAVLLEDQILAQNQNTDLKEISLEGSEEGLENNMSLLN